MRFVEGQQYRTRKRWYTVLVVRGPSMQVRFDDGEVCELTVSSQELIWENIQREKRVQEMSQNRWRNPYDPVALNRNRAYYQMLGFFLSHGHQLEVFVSTESEAHLRDDYFADAGQELPESGVYLHQQKWGRESRIKCVMGEDDIDFLRGLVSECASSTLEMEVLSDGTINCNELMRSLWQSGFRLGVSVQSADAVRAVVPVEYQAVFEEGLSHGLRA